PAVISSTKAPDIFITGLSLADNSHIFDINQDIQLDANDRDFSISFSSPEYEYASSIRYEYRLSNNKWTPLEQATSARFANLGAGKYQFEVRAASPNGTISMPATLLFEILPFYYESWWFKTLILLAIAGVIFLWFRFRLTQLHKLEKMRQSIAADLHDEVGASLTSLQILAELAGRNKNPQEQNEVLSRLRTQTKKATASLREIVWNIHPKNDRLEMFVGELSRYAGEILEDAGISYSIHADPIGPDDKLAIASRQQLARVYKEILSNLIRHSKCTNTEISFTKENHLLVICIRDNGKGFDPEKTERGNGLNNMTDRMKLIHGHIHIQSATNAGTKITFSCRLL
ncbi:MAG: histidine kinase, partial [Saprospiraceae bacterium]